ncbi:MAG: hypothetical protein LC808_44145 [Actinobacteria bacterium]|nr:hypothetical protein [Actinomycetota bacterium]
MSESSTPPEGLKGGEAPRDEGFWAKGRNVLRVSDVPAGAVNLNVDGRRVVGALQSFDQLWQKTCQVRLAGIETTPEVDESRPANSRRSGSDFRNPRLLQWQRC